jgi:hypothetical protein
LILYADGGINGVIDYDQRHYYGSKYAGQQKEAVEFAEGLFAEKKIVYHIERA